MAGYNHVFVRVLIRQAKAATSADDSAAQIAWLTALQTLQFNSVKNGDSTVLSSTLNGKSISFNAPSGMTMTDVMVSIESAIECLEAGLTGPPNMTYGRAY